MRPRRAAAFPTTKVTGTARRAKRPRAPTRKQIEERLALLLLLLEHNIGRLLHPRRHR
jgi:hypothetical protein